MAIVMQSIYTDTAIIPFIVFSTLRKMGGLYAHLSILAAACKKVQYIHVYSSFQLKSQLLLDESGS